MNNEVVAIARIDGDNDEEGAVDQGKESDRQRKEKEKMIEGI